MNKRIAFAAALIWIVHPLATEVISWASGRKYALCAAFGFLALFFFMKCLEKYRFSLSIGSFIACMLSVMSSPFGIVFPTAFYFIDFCTSKTWNPFKVLRSNIKIYIPYIIISLIMGTILWKALVAPGWGDPVTDRYGASKAHLYGDSSLTFFTMMRVVFDTAYNFIYPLKLNCRYPDIHSFSFWQPKVVITSIMLIFVPLFVIWRAIKGHWMHLLCFGWIVIAFLPAANIIPISTKMADRYIYLSSAGVFLYFSWLIHKIKYRKSLIIFIVLLISTLSYLTYERIKVWQTPIALWTDSVKKHPGNDVAWINLGEAYFLNSKDTWSKALMCFFKAMRINPENKVAKSNFVAINMKLGDKRFKQKRYGVAIRYYTEALKMNPGHPLANYNLGLIALRLNQPRAAIKYYTQAVDAHPDFAEAHNNLGSAYQVIGNISKAGEHFKLALKAKPDYAIAIRNLNLIKVQR